MLWICLRFPQLARDALGIGTNPAQPSSGNLHPRRNEVRPHPPHAVIDGPLQRRHVVLANAAAGKAGVHPGQSLTSAQLLCPRLATTLRDAAAERQALESLAAWAYRFSAEIHVAAPDAIFIEAGASLALFGGWPALQRRLRSELDASGFAYALAAAPTATAARVLATCRDGLAMVAPTPLADALGSVPLDASGLDTRTVAALHGMGLRVLRDLFRLPRAELARRIGQASLDHLDRMRGLIAETFPRWRPPDRFERRIEFAFGVESQTALAFPLQRLIHEFALFLIARDGGVQRFLLVLGHERGASTRIEIGLLAPQRNPAALLELARARLERIELVAPVHALSLCADDLPSLCPLHQDLFEPDSHRQADWPALAERLRARLGDSALHGLRCVADHRPARAWRFVEPALDNHPEPRASGSHRDAPVRPVEGKGRATATASTTAPGETSAIVSATPQAGLSHPSGSNAIPLAQGTNPRPFWLLQRPLPLRGTPPRVLAGPERIESGWWDERDQRRDYYLVEIRGGQRAWAFVEAGSPVGAGSTPQWTLHGWFA